MELTRRAPLDTHMGILISYHLSENMHQLLLQQGNPRGLAQNRYQDRHASMAYRRNRFTR
jgi:hypothetical protein